MPLGTLRPYVEESVTVLTETLGPPGRLGPGPSTWVAQTPKLANVQPLGAEAAASMGLVDVRERLRVRISPGVPFKPADRLRARGREWKAIKVELWQSFTLLIVEGV